MPLDVGVPLANPERVAKEVIAQAWLPPAPVDFTAWAKANVVFGGESQVKGPYDPDKFPWNAEILEALTPDHAARVVVVKGSAQIGKTVIAQTFAGGSLDMDPSPFLYCHPSEQNALRWVKQKWKSFVRGTTALSRIFLVDKSRDGGNSLLYQERRDGRGFLQVTGANSEASLSMMSVPRQVQDDLSKWDMNAAGDPEGQADSRSKAFEFAKILKISTPLVEPGCRISRAYDDSSQGEYRVPCPHCAAVQPLTWENFRASVDAIEAARKESQPETPPHFTCEACGIAIEEKHRPWMVAPANGATWVHKNPAAFKRGIWGYYIWAAYTQLESWGRIAEGWLAAKGDPHREQVFLNDSAGLAYKTEGEAPPSQALQERAEASGLEIGKIPAGGLIFSIGVDCQGDRVEWHAKVFGKEMKRWTVEYGVIEGHISEERARKALDALLERTWRDAFGNRRKADILAIDAGAFKSDVKDWARRHPQNRVIMVRGVGGDHAPHIALVREERTQDGKVVKYQKRFWNVGASPLKVSLYKNLQKADPTARGYCGYPAGLSEEFYRQLTAERRVLTKDRRGFPIYVWEKVKGQANEVLDTEIYAESGAMRLGFRTMRDEHWDRLAAERERAPLHGQLDLEDVGLAATGDSSQAAPSDGPQRKGKARDRRTSTWL
jgi:phage terminase large subunit GpA-like protein